MDVVDKIAAQETDSGGMAFGKHLYEQSVCNSITIGIFINYI